LVCFKETQHTSIKVLAAVKIVEDVVVKRIATIESKVCEQRVNLLVRLNLKVSVIPS